MIKYPELGEHRNLILTDIRIGYKVPYHIVVKIARYLAFIQEQGNEKMSDKEFGLMFAKAIDGFYLNSPIGVADVMKDNQSWSMKTVVVKNALIVKKVSLIGGICRPGCCYGILNPHKDVEKTGHAVLNIWNERINITLDHYNLLRRLVLVRSEDCLSYCLFEEDIHRYPSNDYEWSVNSNGNLIGKSIVSGDTVFTWQPHGSQFTIHERIPQNAVRFTIKQPPVTSVDAILTAMDFNPDWVEIIR